MDVFERVREVDTRAELTAEQISKARTSLLGGIEDRVAVARKRAARRPMYLIAGGVVGVAAVTATVLVVNHNAASPPRVEAVPVPSASAVPTPAQTSAPTPAQGNGAGTVRVEPFPGTTPKAGQYLKVTTNLDKLFYRGQDATVFPWLLKNSYTQRPPISALLVREGWTTYVPADRSAEWVKVQGPRYERVRPYPEPQPDGDKAEWDKLLPLEEREKVSREAGGVFDGLASTPDYSLYPRDPQALLDYLWARFPDAGDSREDSVMVTIVDVLRTGFAPPEVRKTFLEALQISGRSVVDSTSGTVTTYGIEYTAVDARRETISIDAATGWSTEYTVTFARDDGGLVPPGVPDERFTYSQEIVDTTP